MIIVMRKDADLNTNKQKKGKGRALDPDDSELWKSAVRDVKKLDFVQVEPERPRAIKPKAIVMTEPEPRASIDNKKTTTSGTDRKTEDKLRRGEIKIEARLDLHGMTASAAREQLIWFLLRAYEAQKRCVLVITGKGASPKSEGVLKREFPHWLEDSRIRAGVLSVTQAAPRHGGGGAWYVYLRKNK